MSRSESRPFRVMVVANDRKMLRRLSRFLNVFGYQVQQAADLERARAVWETSPPDMLIVDADLADAQPWQMLRSDELARAGHYTYVFLLVPPTADDRVTAALEGGVDDFLARPVVFGELLARLRVAARTLEYERRVREQAAVDPQTRLISGSAFGERVASEVKASTGLLACALVDVDFLDCLNRRWGRHTGDQVIQAAAELLRQFDQDCKFLASFGAGRFGALLPGFTDAKALAWAEEVRQAFAEQALTIHDRNVTYTVSIGVAVSESSPKTTPPTQLLEAAQQALRSAKMSGRNCVARSGQFDGETREWEDLATKGRLFESTTARDVMTPIVYTVRADEPVQQAAALLRQTQLGEVPVVNGQGKLVGLVTADRLVTLPGDPGSLVRDVMVSHPPTVSEGTSFPKLMDFFTDDPSPVAIVVRDERPIGCVQCRVLAALCEPLHTQTFAPVQEYSNTSGYLLVPDPGHEDDD